MARIAKKTKPSIKNTPQAPVDEDGYYYLPKALLMEYRALDSECRHTHLCLRVVSQELDALLAKHPEIAQKMAEKAAVIMEVTTKKNALQDVHQVIEDTFNIKVNTIAIDDLTGRMHQVIDGQPQFIEGEPALLRPAPVTKVRTPRRVPKKSKVKTK